MSNDKKTNVTKTTEQIDEQIADLNDLLVHDDDGVQKTFAEAKQVYPVLKMTEAGQIFQGMVIDVIGYEKMNEGRGSILFNLKTQSEKTPVVTFWLNVVAVSQCAKILNVKSIPQEFVEKLSMLEGMTGKGIYIRFNGTKKATKKGYQPYQDYTILEINE